jgi:hypothetical protein
MATGSAPLRWDPSHAPTCAMAAGTSGTAADSNVWSVRDAPRRSRTRRRGRVPIPSIWPRKDDVSVAPFAIS